MAFVTIHFDEGQIAAVKHRLKAVPNKMPVVISRGINNTLKTTRAETVRKMKPVLNLKMTDMRNRIRIYPATYRYWRGKVWIGGRDMPLSKFGARQTTRTHLVTATPAQSVWLYYNKFKKKYGKAARFSWGYKIRRRIPKVTFNLGQRRQTLEPAWVVRIKKYEHVMMAAKNEPPAPLVKNAYEMVFVSNEKILRQARTTISGLRIFAGRLLVKNIETQVRMALAG